jgi:hypothetical protein
MPNDLSHFKNKEQNQEKRYPFSQGEQGSNKQTKLSTLFMMAH